MNEADRNEAVQCGKMWCSKMWCNAGNGQSCGLGGSFVLSSLEKTPEGKCEMLGFSGEMKPRQGSGDGVKPPWLGLASENFPKATGRDATSLCGFFFFFFPQPCQPTQMGKMGPICCWNLTSHLFYLFLSLSFSLRAEKDRARSRRARKLRPSLVSSGEKTEVVNGGVWSVKLECRA